MNRDIFEGKWKQFKGEIQKQWGKLTEDEIDQIEGQHQKLVGLLQERYGYTRERAERELDEFIERQAAPPASSTRY
jgi:uncharacterized protein YjbJ (UPF0337 family)